MLPFNHLESVRIRNVTLTKAAFIYLKYSKHSNIVKYVYNFK